MADQSTSENTPESPKEGTTPTDLWNCCLMGPDKMDVVPSSEDQQLLTLSSTQTYDGQAVAGLEAGNSLAPVSDYPSSMYGPYLPDEVEHLSTDVKDGNAEVGVCGLKNLGNTCFMNSGLQCLLSCPSLCCFLLEEEKIPKDSLIEKFSALVCKFWSGEYSVLHPSEFKETLGFVHTQFKDYRQHDGQEFLALLLDSLHEELNHAKELHNEEDVSEVSTDAGEKETEESTSDVLEKNEVEEESEESRSEMSVSEQEESMDTSILEDSSTQDNVINITKLPSIEEFYMKDVKTLNTNVLREDSPTPMIAVDSDKFPKNDKSPTSKQKSPLKNMVENMNDTSPRSPRFKKTNLPVDKKNRFGNLGGEEVTGKITLQDMDEERDLESIKRMKMDDDDGGTILKSLLLQGRDVIREGPYDVFNVSQDMEEVQKMKDIVMCRRKDTNLYANTASKFPISANNESCNNTFNSDEKLGKFALEPFTIERNLDYKKTETLDIVVESIAGCSQDFKALVKDATVCKHIPFANNQTILVDKAALSKNPCSSALTTDRVGVNEQRASREEIEFFEAEKEWHKYLQRNRSVIIDTFQGQFKSTVICSSCDHVSVTFEPFMYLSLPLPHGMERQIAVTWVPLNRLHYPTRYLFNLLKMETVRHLRSSLVNMVFGGNVPPPNDIILAEVFDNHVARILEDGTHLRYVNDDYRMIYAFEMSPKPESELESQQIHPNNLFSTFSDFAMVETGNPGCNWNMKNDDDVITEAGDVCTTVDDVIVEGDDISSRSDKLEDPHCEAGDVVMQSSESDTAQGSDIFSNIGYFDSNLYSHTCTDGPASSECIGASGDADMTTDISAIASTSQTSDTSAPIDSPCTDNKNNEINVRTEDFNTSWVPNNADMKPWSDGTLTQNNTATTSTVASGGISSDWRSCAICLEELPDHELLTHMECGGALCHICLEVSLNF
uniref:ubiquitinyl hydrolase 1 n=1 Tax=Saccoglossus kowalevskii TaxID=10224 RepID=A0ABM0MPP3_SACKO|nr:PREDICTED: uncharacterized protein LOC100369578 [Saccoglossus kowalevskii]